MLCSILSGSLASQALAQTAPAKNNTDEKIALEKFVVTGSLIPIAAGSPAVPVKTLDAAAIEKTGITTDLADILRRTQPAFYGNNNIGSDRANVDSGDSNGGSALSLRNRTTLVLINGRRAVTSPVVSTGGSSFVDVSTIPVSAIERVEVLSDGASATYGSDAVSGVVNVILKTNYNGAEIGGSYGFSDNPGSWERRSFNATAGASNEKTSVVLTAEWKRSDPLIQNERPFSTGLFRTPTYAGIVSIGTEFYYLNPNSNAPAGTLDLSPAQLVAQGVYSGPLDQTAASQFFDLAAYPTLIAQAERRSIVGAVEHKLTPSTTLFLDGMYSINNSESVLNAQPVSGLVTATSALNPFNASVTARNRFVKFPRIYANESIALRGVAGAKGTLAGTWTYDTAVNYNRTNHYFRNKNLIDGAKYTELVNNGTYNPFARNQAPGVIESMLGTQVRDYVSTLRAMDFRASGEVFDLPAGPVQLGLGANFVWEELDFTNDRFDQTGGWLQATPRQPFNARQNSDGFFGEVRIPVFGGKTAAPGLHNLEVTIAGRFDKYSTTADPTTPKYAVRYLPFNDEFAIRGSYSESFVAPSLYDLYGPLSVGFTSSINITRYNASGTAIGPSGQRQYRSQTGSNVNLNPSESRNWSAGVVWSPKSIKGFSASLDWFSIDERDLIASIPQTTIVQSVEQLGTASPYVNLVRQAQSVAGETHFGTGAPITAPGQVTARPSDEIWITNSIVNVAGYWQQGFDFTLNQKWTMEGIGRFQAVVVGTYLHEYFVQVLPGSNPTDYQDGFVSRGTNTGGLFPRYRTNSRLDWSQRNWTASVGHMFIPGVNDLTNLVPFRTASYHSFDLQAGYTFGGTRTDFLKGLSVAVGVNNVFNKMPPRIPSEGNQSADINAYDPVGRLFYVQARYKF